MLKHVLINSVAEPSALWTLNLLSLLRDVYENSFLHLHVISVADLLSIAQGPADRKRLEVLVVRLTNEKRLLICPVEAGASCRIDIAVSDLTCAALYRVSPTQYLVSQYSDEIICSRLFLDIPVQRRNLEERVLGPMFRNAQRVTFVDRYIRLGYAENERQNPALARYHESFEWYFSVLDKFPKVKNREIITNTHNRDEHNRLLAWTSAHNATLMNLERDNDGMGGVPHGRYILTNSVGLYVDVGLDLSERDMVRPTEIFTVASVSTLYGKITKRRAATLA